MRLETALGDPPPSYARVEEPTRPPLRVGAVQHRWHPDPDEHQAALGEGIALAAEQGAKLVCLQELTLSPYFAITPDGPREPEDVEDGPTRRFAARMAAEHEVHVHASLYERADGEDGLGYNTAIVVAPGGELLARTRKLHIPVTAGYHEDRYFRPGPAGTEAFRCSPSARPASGCRPAGTSGSPSSPAPTAWRGPRCWSTRPRSAPSPTTPASTPSRSGSR